MKSAPQYSQSRSPEMTIDELLEPAVLEDMDAQQAGEL